MEPAICEKNESEETGMKNGKCGDTPQDALRDFDRKLCRRRIRTHICKRHELHTEEEGSECLCSCGYRWQSRKPKTKKGEMTW